MGAADNLLGEALAGQRSGIAWSITEKIGLTTGHTPGAFSVAYKCVDPNGRQAFLKASDLTKVIGADPRNIIGNILSATTAHDFERKVLDHCHGNAMDKVVTAIDFGSQPTTHNGIIDIIFFLVFELAEGDLRKKVEKRAKLDLIWTTSTLHDYAVAVSQLHSGEIYHNDLKPANALTFGDKGGKIADLGRATTPHFPVAHENEQCAGDLRFAPPEQLYPNDAHQAAFDRFTLFRAGDLYNLGSLAHYLLTGRSVTIEVISRLRPELRPRTLGGGWTDTVEAVLPHWNAAFLELMREAPDVIPGDWNQGLRDDFNKIVKMINSLCEPDIKRRGALIQQGKPAQYDLQRYISALDLLRQHLMIRVASAS